MGPAGEHGRGPFTKYFDGWMSGALEVELLSQRKFCEGNLEEGLLYWGHRRIC